MYSRECSRERERELPLSESLALLCNMDCLGIPISYHVAQAGPG